MDGKNGCGSALVTELADGLLAPLPTSRYGRVDRWPTSVVLQSRPSGGDGWRASPSQPSLGAWHHCHMLSEMSKLCAPFLFSKPLHYFSFLKEILKRDKACLGRKEKGPLAYSRWKDVMWFLASPGVGLGLRLLGTQGES